MINLFEKIKNARNLKKLMAQAKLDSEICRENHKRIEAQAYAALARLDKTRWEIYTNEIDIFLNVIEKFKNLEKTSKKGYDRDPERVVWTEDEFFARENEISGPIFLREEKISDPNLATGSPSLSTARSDRFDYLQGILEPYKNPEIAKKIIQNTYDEIEKSGLADKKLSSICELADAYDLSISKLSREFNESIGYIKSIFDSHSKGEDSQIDFYDLDSKEKEKLRDAWTKAQALYSLFTQELLDDNGQINPSATELLHKVQNDYGV